MIHVHVVAERSTRTVAENNYKISKKLIFQKIKCGSENEFCPQKIKNNS